MAIIRKNELNSMKREQLNTRLNELRKELMRFNAQKSGGSSPENPGRIGEIKKTIAKILFKLSEVDK